MVLNDGLAYENRWKNLPGSEVPVQSTFAKYGRDSKGKYKPGVLKQAATRMKAETLCKRKTYDSWPNFIRHTLRDAEKPYDQSKELLEWRKFPLPERITVAERLKEEGNDKFRSGAYDDAEDLYSRAAGLFYYVKRLGYTPADGTVHDVEIKIIEERGEGGDNERILALTVACYSNIAQCCLKRDEATAALVACDWALDLAPNNTKVLYRRAQARRLRGGHQDLEEAVKDLTAAAEVSPDDQAIKDSLRQVRTEIRKIVAAEQKQFQGFLKNQSIGSGEASGSKKEEQDSLEKAAEDADNLYKIYKDMGQEEDAEDMRIAAEKARARLAERAKRSYNVMKPDEDMIKKAKEFGIDLTDPEQRRKCDEAAYSMYKVNNPEEGEDAGEKQEKSKDEQWSSKAGELMRDYAVIAVVVVALIFFWLVTRQAFTP